MTIMLIRKSQSILVSFTGFLSNGLHMVTVIGVTEYSPEIFDKVHTFKVFGALSFYSEDLEEVAEKFLQKYYRPAKEPMPILLDGLRLTWALNFIRRHFLTTFLAKFISQKPW